jgi:curli production assembly/transport component CsgG
MKKTFISLAIISLLSGCAVMHRDGVLETKPEVTKVMMQKEFDTIAPPVAAKPVSVAVYSFQDKTGQRRPQANIASLSTAVTQGAETFLIQALQNVGRGQWFEVVERVGIDNLTKERTIIRQMREAYEGPQSKPLMPMQFAGLIIEGGIIGYDSSTKSGGIGARWLGIGAQTQYSEDIVTVSLRAVSVNTGKVLISVTVQKTILSTADSVTALKFFDEGTKAFEGEAGLTINEPGTYAVKSAIEAAVVELIKEGERKGVWGYQVTKVEPKEAPAMSFPQAPPAAEPVISADVRKEEKKDELVQPKTTEAPTTASTPVTPVVESSKPTSDAGSKEQGAKEEAKSVAPTEWTAYLNQDAYVYKEANEKSERTWLLKKGQEFLANPAIENGWVAVRTKGGRRGYVREEVLSTNVQKSN